jgi:hypothetical protein
MSDIEDAEAAQEVDVFAAAQVAERVAAGVSPLDGGVGRAVRGGLAVFEEAGIHVIPKGVDRLARYPSGLGRFDRGARDHVQDMAGIGAD